MNGTNNPQFPQYTPPPQQGIQVAHPKQGSPLNKLIGRMLPKRFKGPSKGKGIHTNQSVKIKHKKIPFY